MSQMNLKSIYWCFLKITNLSGALILMLTLTLTSKSIRSVTETPARCLLSLWHRLHLIPRSERTPSFISFCLPYFSESVPCRSRNKPLCDVTKCTGTKMAPLPGLVSTQSGIYYDATLVSAYVFCLFVCLFLQEAFNRWLNMLFFSVDLEASGAVWIIYHAGLGIWK